MATDGEQFDEAAFELAAFGAPASPESLVQLEAAIGMMLAGARPEVFARRTIALFNELDAEDVSDDGELEIDIEEADIAAMVTFESYYDADASPAQGVTNISISTKDVDEVLVTAIFTPDSCLQAFNLAEASAAQVLSIIDDFRRLYQDKPEKASLRHVLRHIAKLIEAIRDTPTEEQQQAIGRVAVKGQRLMADLLGEIVADSQEPVVHVTERSRALSEDRILIVRSHEPQEEELDNSSQWWGLPRLSAVYHDLGADRYHYYHQHQDGVRTFASATGQEVLENEDQGSSDPKMSEALAKTVLPRARDIDFMRKLLDAALTPDPNTLDEEFAALLSES